MASALHTVEATGFGRFMREALYAYPIAETIHIWGIALLFGSIALVDLRLLGLGRRMPIALLAHYAVPWTLLGFLIAALSGLSMFTAHAAEFIVQPVFMLKMGLILAGGINAAVLHMGPLRDLASADVDPTATMRLAGGLSLVFWLGVIACGRMLAYL